MPRPKGHARQPARCRAIAFRYRSSSGMEKAEYETSLGRVFANDAEFMAKIQIIDGDTFFNTLVTFAAWRRHAALLSKMPEPHRVSYVAIPCAGQSTKSFLDERLQHFRPPDIGSEAKLLQVCSRAAACRAIQRKYHRRRLASIEQRQSTASPAAEREFPPTATPLDMSGAMEQPLQETSSFALGEAALQLSADDWLETIFGGAPVEYPTLDTSSAFDCGSVNTLCTLPGFMPMDEAACDNFLATESASIVHLYPENTFAPAPDFVAQGCSATANALVSSVEAEIFA